MKIASLVLSVLFSFSALAQQQIVIGQGNNDRKVIGPDNTKLVDANMINLPFKYRDAAEAIGLMSMGCTGTHIGNGLVISAGHCFQAAKIPSYSSSCAGVSISWGVRNGKKATSVSNCRQILVMSVNNRTDYALFRVDSAPRVSLKIKLQGRPQINSRVTILSHPFRDPLTWSGFCDIRKTFTYGLNMYALQHNCDTNPGSSGAAILDAATVEVVGIHDGGVAQGLSGSNYGTFIDATPIPEVLKRFGYR